MRLEEKTEAKAGTLIGRIDCWSASTGDKMRKIVGGAYKIPLLVLLYSHAFFPLKF